MIRHVEITSQCIVKPGLGDEATAAGLSLTGEEWHVSKHKADMDKVLADRLAPFVHLVHAATIHALRPQLSPKDPFYEEPRINQYGDFENIRKIKTMWEGGVSDEQLAFSKRNPRILSRRAALARTLGLDEVTDLLAVIDYTRTGTTSTDNDRIARRSMVGSKWLNKRFLDHMQATGSSALFDEWHESVYLNPNIPRGATGPGHLVLHHYSERGPKEINAFISAELNYLPNATLEGDCHLIDCTPLNLLFGILPTQVTDTAAKFSDMAVGTTSLIKTIGMQAARSVFNGLVKNINETIIVKNTK